MPFIVEDGTGLENANSFVSVEYADEYFALRGYEEWNAGDPTDQQKEAWLIIASEYTNLKKFRGTAKTENQRLQFPRILAGFAEMPEILLNAVCEYALRAKQNVLIPDPKYDASGMRIIKQTSSLVTGMNKSVEYDANSPFILTRYFPYPDQLLEPLLLDVGGNVSFLRR